MANEEKPKVENVATKTEVGNKAVPTAYNAEEAVEGDSGEGAVVLATNGGVVERIRVSAAAAGVAKKADAMIREKLEAYDAAADEVVDHVTGRGILANDQQARYDAEREEYNRQTQEYYMKKLEAEQQAVAAAAEAATFVRKRSWLS